MALRLVGHRTYPSSRNAYGERSKFGDCRLRTPVGCGGLGDPVAARIDLGRIVFVYCGRVGRDWSGRRDVCKAGSRVPDAVVFSIGAEAGTTFGLAEDCGAWRVLDGVSAEHVSVCGEVCFFCADGNVERRKSTVYGDVG